MDLMVMSKFVHICTISTLEKKKKENRFLEDNV